MLYIPILPVYFFGVLLTRRWLYFTAANPGIYMGGFFGEQKDEILDLIPSDYKVKTISVVRKYEEDELKELLRENSLVFPLVVKPNVGERGEGVQIVYSIDEIMTYGQAEQHFLIQEYTDYELELGVLFYKMPNEISGQVSSITQKEFLHVIGDGKHNVLQLLQMSQRGLIYEDLVKKEFSVRLNEVPHKNEVVTIHRIGNHSKGTRFIDANKHINERLNATFSQLSKHIPSVYCGRYDLKVPNYSDLEQGMNIKIFEMNGVSSEPGHIYDQGNVFSAYIFLTYHWLAIIQISRINLQRGMKTTPLSVFYKTITNHFWG